MDAHVYLDGNGNHMISLRVGEMVVDEAGPFDDETDAVMAARRCIYGDGQIIMAAKGTLFSDSPRIELEAT